MRASIVGSAQWMSSTTKMTGRSAARWVRSRLTAQNNSSTGNGSTDTPSADASRAVTSSPAWSDSAASFALTSIAESSLTMPARPLTASATGQNVIPSP